LFGGALPSGFAIIANERESSKGGNSRVGAIMSAVFILKSLAIGKKANQGRKPTMMIYAGKKGVNPSTMAVTQQL